MDADNKPLNDLSAAIIGRALAILNRLGPGFLEKVYENALAHELRKSGSVKQQHGIEVYYDNIAAGAYAVDLLVEGKIRVELKAVRALDANHTAQCLNYLKATRLQLCLLLNFGGSRLELKRLANNLSPNRLIPGSTHGTTRAMSALPLKGLLVVSLEQAVAAPYCSSRLADKL